VQELRETKSLVKVMETTTVKNLETGKEVEATPSAGVPVLDNKQVVEISRPADKESHFNNPPKKKK
jgi:hypothetical protein